VQSRNQPPKVCYFLRQELAVRYVLEGSVLARARHVRVNAVTDEHLWAERFDKERKDILKVQDEIVARLSRGVGIEMVRSKAAGEAPIRPAKPPSRSVVF
jgi:adenylate cyclase